MRQHLSQPIEHETLGCYVSMLRFVTVEPRNGFAALAADVQNRIDQAARRGDRPPGP